MALFVCLQALAECHDFRLCAVHVDHGIRGAESRRDASFVESVCRESAVPLHLLRADVPGEAAREKIGLELAARNVRRRYFRQLREAGVVDAVATAHHMEDNAETLLLHMMRGAGLEGLAGMEPRGDGLIRPFLCVHRQEIRDYLRQKKQPWMEDSTNADLRYDRNFVRQIVLPDLEHLNPRAVEALNRLAENAGRDLACLRKEAERAAAAVTVYAQGEAQLDIAALQRLPEAVRLRVLRIVLARLGRAQDVEQAHLEALSGLAENSRSGSALDLGGGWRAEVCYGRLLLGKMEDSVQADYEEKINLAGTTELPTGTVTAVAAAERLAGSGFSEFLDRDRIPEGAVLRTRRAGDVFRPLHGSGRKKLKDYFIDIKLPRAERGRVPLLADGPRILWVIGHRLSEDVAVGEDTKRIVHLRYAERTDGSAAALR